MQAEKKANTTYTFSLTDMTEREVRMLLMSVHREIREVSKVLRIANRSSNAISAENRRKRLQAKLDDFHAMRQALAGMLGEDYDDEDDEDEEPGEG